MDNIQIICAWEANSIPNECIISKVDFLFGDREVSVSSEGASAISATAEEIQGAVLRAEVFGLKDPTARPSYWCVELRDIPLCNPRELLGVIFSFDRAWVFNAEFGKMSSGLTSFPGASLSRR
ncbi:MAG: hypothetical protein KBC64_04970 [Simkaniaceae bacterium]|nr:hypothetical protein [Simkaniaceae bacterium]